MTNNPIIRTDSYKIGHPRMMHPDTDRSFSYYEARTGAVDDPEIVFFGLQANLMANLVGRRVHEEHVYDAESFLNIHLGRGSFDPEPWLYIANDLEGRIPLRIRAVPEGSVHPAGTVLVTVETTDPQLPWVGGHFEALLSHTWYTCVVATRSRAMKKLLAGHLLETTGSLDGLEFALHDFGYRSVTSPQSGELGAMAHLVNFKGTDTMPGAFAAHELYRAHYGTLAFSVAASEHSVMTAGGRAGESEVVGRLLAEFPTGVLSLVGDSYDIYEFTDRIIGQEHHDAILSRNGKVVIRPDSPTPTEEPPEEVVTLLGMLERRFGATTNSQGFKVLDPHVGLLWGDGLERSMIERILEAVAGAGYATSNLVLGMGGGLLQKGIDRDVERFAFECSAQHRRGTPADEWVPLAKDPLDPSKRSRGGRHDNPHLITVFEDGHLVHSYDFDQVRENAAIR